MKIWVKKIENENGNYIDLNNVRYTVDWCIKVIYADGSTEEDLGYTRFDNLQNALDTWNLKQWIDPDLTEEEITAE